MANKVSTNKQSFKDIPVAGKKKNRGKEQQPPVVNMERPMLSVCMIVRNEEKNLGTCLESIKAVADELIIVDTGSNDGTITIARRYTDKVFIHPWEDNFSKARNQALAYATGDWILIIDADEELIQEDIPNLRNALEDGEIDTIMAQVISKYTQEKGEGILNSVRLFRNNGIIRYEGRVHNRVVGLTNARVYPIRIIHYGYDLAKPRAEEKFDRTVSLLKMDLADDPENSITYHYLSRAYLGREMYWQALEASLTAIRLAEAKHDRNLLYLWSHYTAAISCYRLHDLKRAEEISLSALKKYSKHIDSHFMLILVYFDTKRWAELIEHGSEYLRLIHLLRTSPVLFDNLVTCSLNDEWNMHVLMGIGYFELGLPDEASVAFEKAASSAIEPFIALRAVGIYFFNKKEMGRARRYLERAGRLDNRDETVKNLLGQIPAVAAERQKEPTISLCMIVKNEEAFLEQCLKSIKDYVDEIIIVDTGSTDRTVDIAEGFTDKIYFHAWENSFSMARNQSLTYATGDWIFIMDADEEMLPGSGELLRQAACEAGKADAILVNTVSTYSNGNKTARHNSERLFRNNGIIHYEGIVHNLVVGHSSVKSSRIELMHYGYDLEEKKASEKFIRTTELLKKQIEEEPDNPMPHHYLGTSYLSRGFNREAAEESVLAVDLADRQNNDHPLYLWARHNAAISFFRLGDLAKARDYSLSALAKYPEHLDSLYTMTMLAAEKGEWTNVLTFGKKYLERRRFYEKNPDAAGLIINCTMKEGTAINLLMGHAFHALHDQKRAAEHYREAHEIADEKWKAWWNIGVFHMDRSGDLELARRYLDMTLTEVPEESSAWYMLAKLNKKCGLPAGERSCLEQLFRLKTDDLMLLNRLATLCLEAGDLDQALEVTNAALTADRANYPALCNLGLIHKRKRAFEESIRAFLQAVETHPYGVAPWINLGEISLSLNNLADAKFFFERALSFQNGLTDVLLHLCNIEFNLNSIDDFVSHADQLLQVLGLERNRTLNTMEDIAVMLLDINFALRHRSESAALVFNTLSLLPIDYHALYFDWIIRDPESGQNREKSSFITKRLDELRRLAKKPEGAFACTIN